MLLYMIICILFEITRTAQMFNFQWYFVMVLRMFCHDSGSTLCNSLAVYLYLIVHFLSSDEVSLDCTIPHNTRYL